MLTVALSTGSLYTYGMARVFELAAETGFDGVEVLIDARWDTRQPAYLRRLSAASGLPIVAVHSPFMPHVPGWPQDPVRRLQASAAVAHEVGAGVVVAHLPLRIRGAKVEFFESETAPKLLPFPMPAGSGYRRFLTNGLARFEAEERVCVAVENMPAKRWLGRRWDIHALNTPEALATLPHLTLDTTHLGTWGLDPVSVYERLKGRIRHVHLSDYDGREHRLPGSGRLPLSWLLQRLAQDSYEGAVSLEFGPEALQAEDEGQVLANLRLALAFCREHGRRRP